jgi:hypothetical protein
MTIQTPKDKLTNLTEASRKFINNESQYSLKNNLLKLCTEYAITPQELFDFVSTLDLEREQPLAEKETLAHLNGEEDENEEGDSIQMQEITELAEVVDELPAEERQYPPGWSS